MLRISKELKNTVELPSCNIIFSLNFSDGGNAADRYGLDFIKELIGKSVAYYE